MVVFVPPDAEPPADYQERLESLGIRTEMFFSKWLKRWGYKTERSEIFDRDEEGRIRVEVVKGELTDVKSKDTVIREVTKITNKTMEKRTKLGRNSGVHYWIFYQYPGAKGFRGGKKRAVARYPRGGTGALDLKAKLGSEEMEKSQTKAAIHEFGHAFGSWEFIDGSYS